MFAAFLAPLEACVFVTLLASGQARAGAFMQPTGHGQVIAELAFSEARFAYDAFGRATVIPAWRKFELSTYAEYGLNESITLIGEPQWFSFRAQPPGRRDTRAAAGEAGARVKIVEWGESIISAQATGRYATGGRWAALYYDMRDRVQADLRLLYGRKTEIFGYAGYVDLQIGFRSRAVLGHQVRFDATYAIRPFERVTLMFQSFTTITPGRLGDRFMLRQKMKASVVYDLTDALSFQIGLMAGVRGVNSSAERGIVSAIWWKF